MQEIKGWKPQVGDEVLVDRRVKLHTAASHSNFSHGNRDTMTVDTSVVPGRITSLWGRDEDKASVVVSFMPGVTIELTAVAQDALTLVRTVDGRTKGQVDAWYRHHQTAHA